MTDSMSIRELFCLIEGDRNHFKVSININKDVNDLKEVIREKCKYGRLRTIDVKDLVVWKVSTLQLVCAS